MIWLGTPGFVAGLVVQFARGEAFTRYQVQTHLEERRPGPGTSGISPWKGVSRKDKIKRQMQKDRNREGPKGSAAVSPIDSVAPICDP